MFKTKADLLVEFLEAKREVSVEELSTLLDTTKEVILTYAQYLEEAGILSMKFRPTLKLVVIKSPETGVQFKDEKELINKIKILLEVNNLKAINKILYDLYSISKKTKNEKLVVMYKKAYNFFYDYLKKIKIVDLGSEQRKKKVKELIKEIDNYRINADKFFMYVKIVKQEFELVPYYILSLLEYGSVTEIVLKKVKDEIIRTISLL